MKTDYTPVSSKLIDHISDMEPLIIKARHFAKVIAMAANSDLKDEDGALVTLAFEIIEHLGFIEGLRCEAFALARGPAHEARA